jgi:hypothetical protein
VDVVIGRQHRPSMAASCARPAAAWGTSMTATVGALLEALKSEVQPAIPHLDDDLQRGGVEGATTLGQGVESSTTTKPFDGIASSCLRFARRAFVCSHYVAAWEGSPT